MVTVPRPEKSEESSEEFTLVEQVARDSFNRRSRPPFSGLLSQNTVMSTAATEAYPSGLVISRENLLFDFPEADLILRSRDSYEFRVLKLYIIHSSPILREKVLLSPNPQPEPSVSANPAVSSVEANAPCVVQLPMDGAVLFSLLTFIFPVPPVLPSTVEQTMELISVAQLYKLDVALTHIKIHIDRQEPSFI